MTRLDGCFVLVLFPALYFYLTRFGSIGVGCAYLTAQPVNVPLEMSTTKRLLQSSWNDVKRVVWRPVLGACARYCIMQQAKRMTSAYAPLARLLMDGAVVAAGYRVIILLLWLVSARPMRNASVWSAHA